MTKLFGLVSILALAGTFAACNGGSGGGGGTTVNTSLIGTWVKACQTTGGASSETQTLAVTSLTAATYSNVSYSDTTCGVQSGNSSGAVVLAVGSASSTVSGATNIDLTPTGIDAGCGVGVTSYTLYLVDPTTGKLGLGRSSGGADTGCTSSANRLTLLDGASEQWTRQ
jgi:hypothetical protein